MSASQKSRDRLVGTLIVALPAAALLLLIRTYQAPPTSPNALTP